MLTEAPTHLTAHRLVGLRASLTVDSMPRTRGHGGQGDGNTGTGDTGTRRTGDKGTRDKGTRGQGDGTRGGSRWRFKPHLITSHQARRFWWGLETLALPPIGEVSPELPLSPCPLLVSNGISPSRRTTSQRPAQRLAAMECH